METIAQSDLILQGDGSIYHLSLLPEDIAPTIILVGDPGRVPMVSGYFDHVETVKSNREFLTHTGHYKGTRISVLATGIGTDNIDIVINELDALFNVDLKQRIPRKEHRKMTLVRLGTSGALHPEVEPGTRILSRMACGFDSLYHFYKDSKLYLHEDYRDAFMQHTAWPDALSHPYFVSCSEKLASRYTQSGYAEGITISTPGFYAPQVRQIRLAPFDPDLIEKIADFRYGNMKIQNFEMECSALYGLSALLGHDALTICVAVANRVKRTFPEDYHRHVDAMIRETLDILCGHD